MTAEGSPRAVPKSLEPKSPEVFMKEAEDPAVLKTPKFSERGLDSCPQSDFLRANGQSSHHLRSSSSSAVEIDDSFSLHSLASGGNEEELEQKPEFTIPLFGLHSPYPRSSEVKTDALNYEKGTPEADQHDLSSSNPGFGEPVLGKSVGTKFESSSLEESPSGSKGETELSLNADHRERFPEKKPSVSSTRTEGDAEMLTHAGGIGKKSSVADAEGACGISSSELPPALESPKLVTPFARVKTSALGSLPTRKLKDDELRAKVVIPYYLSKGMATAIKAAGVISNEDPRIDVKVPEAPLLVFINSKSGGRLGPQLAALLKDLIAPAQVYDLSECKPSDVLRYGLGYLEKESNAGDEAALQTRNNIRIMVAGGDGTVGWVLGSIRELRVQEPFKVPPVGVIPLGTGNDLSRSFRWGGSTTSVSRRKVKRGLVKAIEADVATLDSWQVVVKPVPARNDSLLKLPHAMHPQHHVPIEHADNSKEEATASHFEGSFWNYFSLGMDAQVAYGFHHLRNEAPWLASGRLSNQMVYGGYGCAQGWFCTPCATVPVARGLKQIAKVYVRRHQDVDGQWDELDIPSNIRALVILNLQSYAGGRNPWGHPSSNRQQKKGFVEAKCNDGILEIVGLRDGWHTTFVLLDWFTAVRLGQAIAVRLELKGRAHRRKAYMQMDGEPWQQPLGGENDPPAVIEMTCCSTPSQCLIRK